MGELLQQLPGAGGSGSRGCADPSGGASLVFFLGGGGGGGEKRVVD